MADFFSRIAEQVLGAAPEVRPLLPPRFAHWLGLPHTGLAQDSAPSEHEHEGVFEPAAKSPSFPFPLVDPASPSYQMPLPTFQQMSRYRPGSLITSVTEHLPVHPPSIPSIEAVDQDAPEASVSELGVPRSPENQPARTSLDYAPPSKLQSVPAPPSTARSESLVIQTQPDHASKAAASREATAMTPPASPDEAVLGVDLKDFATSARPTGLPEKPDRLQPSESPDPAVVQNESGQDRTAYIQTPTKPVTDFSMDVTRQREQANRQLDSVAPKPAPTVRLVEPIESRPEPVDRQPTSYEPEIRPGNGPPELFEPAASLLEQVPESIKAQATAEAQPQFTAASLQRVSGGTTAASLQSRSENLTILPSQDNPVAALQIKPNENRLVPGEIRGVNQAEQPPTTAMSATDILRQGQLGQQAPDGGVGQTIGSNAATGLIPAAKFETGAQDTFLLDGSTITPLVDATGSSSSTADQPSVPMPLWVTKIDSEEREPVIIPVQDPSLPLSESSTGRKILANSPQLPRFAADVSQTIPTVHVSIGRVIVRASLADERPSSQRAELPRPPLSLDEYLKRRQGGEQ